MKPIAAVVIPATIKLLHKDALNRDYCKVAKGWIKRKEVNVE